MQLQSRSTVREWICLAIEDEFSYHSGVAYLVMVEGVR